MADHHVDLRIYLENFVDSASRFLLPARIERGTLLHRSGTVCRDLFIVHEGVCRSFYYRGGLDVTSHFTVDYGIISAIDSLLTRAPSKYSIEVLEDARVSRISIEGYEKFLLTNPQHERSARQLTQAIYLELADRVESILFHRAEERYRALTTRHPDIVNRVNLGHIASFLGISPETLSRIRKIKNE